MRADLSGPYGSPELIDQGVDLASSSTELEVEQPAHAMDDRRQLLPRLSHLIGVALLKICGAIPKPSRSVTLSNNIACVGDAIYDVGKVDRLHALIIADRDSAQRLDQDVLGL